MTNNQPVVSVDPVALTFNRGTVQVILTTRQYEPFRHRRALPGVMLEPGESAAEAARRGLLTKCGVAHDDISWQMAGSYNDESNRDPRGATISLTQIVIVKTGSHVCDGTWHVDLDKMPNLPFAQTSIVADAVEMLGARLWNDTGILPAFLGQTFSSSDASDVALALGVGTTRGHLARKLRSLYHEAGTSGGRVGRPSSLWSTTAP